MSIDVWFEADVRLPEDKLAHLLLKTSTSQFELENGVIGSSFSSGMSAFPEGPQGDTHIKAEDTRGANFVVGSRCTFRPSIERYDESLEELQQFLLAVAEETEAHFVVSFQLEETLFVNVGRGVERCF